jgi:glycosyltransferase involved in cell wall biosynthesis
VGSSTAGTGVSIASYFNAGAGFNPAELTLDASSLRITGALAEPFEPLSLARAIHWVLADRDRHAGLRSAARERALREWAPARIAARYAELYRAAR